MLKKLITIQHDLKAPKKQYNSFGKYNYRNQEDILEALKPLLYAQGLVLTLSDSIITVGESLFVEAKATISDGEKSMSTVAQAGLDLNKKGMDKAKAYAKLTDQDVAYKAGGGNVASYYGKGGRVAGCGPAQNKA